jgi:uncharacterized protein (TIGR02147 family)
MSTSFKVFAFTDPIEFLNHSFRERQKKNPRLSLRAWARQLGYENPSQLSDVLKRRRTLKMDLVSRIAANLNLAGKSLRYFELISLQASSRSDREKEVYAQMIDKIRPRRYRTLVEWPVETFEMASEWHHWAILEIVNLKDFDPTPDYLRERLGLELPKKRIQESVDRLIRMGFLEKTPNGFQRATADSYFMKDIPSAAIRAVHKQLLSKALAAIDEQTNRERNSRATTLAFKEEDFLKACEILEDTHKRLLGLSAEADSAGEELYHLNTQFFRLTKKKKKRGYLQ